MRIACENIEELRPLRGRPRIGHVAGQEDKIEWLFGVSRGKRGQCASQPGVSPRAGASALDAKSIFFADDVNV